MRGRLNHAFISSGGEVSPFWASAQPTNSAGWAFRDRRHGRNTTKVKDPDIVSMTHGNMRAGDVAGPATG